MHWKQFDFGKQFSKYYDGEREGVQGPATLLSPELFFLLPKLNKYKKTII